jgi:lipid A disaccharide synthetase
MQKELITRVKQKIDTQKCTDLNLIIEQHQVKQMQNHQKTIQTITTKLTEIAFSHKQLLSLNKKVDNLQKQQTKHSEVLKAKIDIKNA